MSRRLVPGLLVALAALGLATDAEARPRKHRKKAAIHHVHKKKTSKAKTKVAARKPTSKPSNMPGGWTWPPSPAMVGKGKACTDELDLLGIGWKPAPREPKITTPITLTTMALGGVKIVSTFRKPPHVMDCHLALGLATHTVQLYALGIREIHFSRIYGYTQVRSYGSTKHSLSRHALGLAIDVRAVVDEAGHKATVVDDYLKDDPLLLRVEDYLNDSGGFRTVLTPRNDPASHDDHFHVEVRVDY